MTKPAGAPGAPAIPPPAIPSDQQGDLVSTSLPTESAPPEEAGGSFTLMPHETSGSQIAKRVADLGGTPWGQKEICTFTGKSDATVRQWVFYKPSTAARPPFPKPDYIVGGRPAWAESTLLAYWVRWGYTRDEPMPADMLRRAKAKLKRWGVRAEVS